VFRWVVNAAETLAAVGVVVVVVFLFANEPGTASAGSPGARIFQADCASCHGASGEGVVGPRLAGGVVVRRFPNEADQIAFVAAGRGAMPAFGATLSPVELRQVVDYTRTGLGK
jgi:cytochrome c oxidase subunit 2